ncbi:MAG TPA: hypothetical protein VGD71_01770 [Kribbella sp.]
MADEEQAGWSDLEGAASRVVGSYAAQGPIGFAYGQGSAFTRFSADSDVDVVIIWDTTAPSQRTYGDGFGI